MGLYQQGKKIGYSHTKLVRHGDQLQWEEQTLMRVLMLGAPQEIDLRIQATAGGDLQLRRANVALKTEAAVVSLTATVDGSDLRVTGSMNGDAVEQHIKLTEPVSLASLARQGFSFELPRPGLAIERRVFEPLTQQTVVVRFRIEGSGKENVPGMATEQGWKASQEMRGMRSQLWLSDRGEVLREEGPMGLTLVRETAQIATAVAADPGWDITAAAALPVRTLIDDPRHACALTLRLLGTDLGFVVTGGAVERTDQTLKIRQIDAAEIKDYALPYAGGDLQDELQSEPFVETNDEKIRLAAKKAIGDATTAVAATKALVDWVYRYVDKVPVASVPDAVQVLQSARGDCNEHAVLLAALGRSVGLPVRVASGLLYADGVFLFHAWNEVWLGVWVPVDATLNQTSADATHVRLAIGGLSGQSVLAQIVGSVSAEVVESATCSP